MPQTWARSATRDVARVYYGVSVRLGRSVRSMQAGSGSKVTRKRSSDRPAQVKAVMIDQPIVSVQDFRKTLRRLRRRGRHQFRRSDRGEIFGLLGPNGAGKTSTLECLEGLRQPDGGSAAHPGRRPGAPARASCAT